MAYKYTRYYYDNTSGAMQASYSWTNKQHLLELVMNQLNLTEEDLDLTPSEFKAKIRDINIDKILMDVQGR